MDCFSKWGLEMKVVPQCCCSCMYHNHENNTDGNAKCWQPFDFKTQVYDAAIRKFNATYFSHEHLFGLSFFLLCFWNRFHLSNIVQLTLDICGLNTPQIVLRELKDVVGYVIRTPSSAVPRDFKFKLKVPPLLKKKNGEKTLKENTIWCQL